ncbi:hypothetical protein KR222_010387, partial [Zaprionus bogoriensis]
YEQPTSSSLARYNAAPALALAPAPTPSPETLRRASGMGRGANCASRQRSEKQIQTEDICDEQFLNAALLKCTEQSGGQASLLRGCSEGDEPLALGPRSDEACAGHAPLRRSASNFELGKMLAQRSSYHSVPCALHHQLDAVPASGSLALVEQQSAKRQKQQQQRQQQEEQAAERKQGVKETADGDDDGGPLPSVRQLDIPDITDVEKDPQLDEPLSARSGCSQAAPPHSRTRCDADEHQSLLPEQQQHQQQQPQETQQQVLLTEPQRVSLLEAAQARQRELIWQYNRLPISMGTLRVRNLKLQLEQQLDLIDGDLTVLNLPQVYI